MKYLLTVLMVIAFITVGCDKIATDPDENNDLTQYTTANVKTATEYFSFTTNSGSTNAGSAYDLLFFTVKWRPVPQAPEISDPRFTAKEGLSIAVLKDKKLTDVTEVPAGNEFIVDYSTATDGWYHMTEANLVLPDENVYVVNTTDGKFPAFVVTGYYDEQGNSGVFNIEWKYLND